ncbi:MAG TPA: GNAT family N-acetyltransferase [Candidatus Salinicoccus stercoripullorum]|uniref:GNAT family N-acetyltransferase n=1 Tax=Candidatus Salinicoccus stercoripullorum TaxID=2838756 RepID=A0A9D1QJD0_9STAP|nr:GNAT family N-acetyltransferase [Candidatus Salinicoccus stercoripullorum]
METAFLSKRPQYKTEVARIIFERFHLDERRKGTFKETVKFFSQSGITGYPITMIALKGGKCVGTVSIYRNDLPERPAYQPWLAALYVLPDFRGQGVADRLVRDMLNHLSGLGYETIYAKTETQSRYDYYMQKGWELLETVDVDGRDNYIFRKRND